MRVYIIAHGSAQTGMGHVMRSISLAEAFRAHGHTVTFFSKYGQGISRIQGAGIEVNKIPAGTSSEGKGFFYGNPGELVGDLAAVRKQIVKKADAIIVDSYNVSCGFFNGLREMTDCLVYVDDLNLFPYPVDILVNGTAAAFGMGFEKSQSAQLLLGMEYNQVRGEFSGLLPRRTQGDITDILITTGNSDPFHMTEKILRMLTAEGQFSRFKYHVIVGGGFEKDIWSDADILGSRQVRLYDSPGNMREIMTGCDLAISAGGSTLYELAACGLPTAAFAYADNQLLHIKALERQGALKYIGYYNELEGQNLAGCINQLMRAEIRQEMSIRQQALVDGKGCRRIVEKIEVFMVGKN